MIKKRKIIRQFLRAALFTAGLAFLAAAVLGHAAAYSTAAVCFSAALVLH